MGVIETLAEAAKLVQKLDNIELVKALLALQKECYDLVFENKNLREKLTKAEDVMKIRETLVFRDNFYWINGGTDSASGPICSTCWDTKTHVVRMIRDNNGYAHCYSCKTVIDTEPGR